MERLQLGPIHPCLLEEYLEQENGGLGSISCGGQFINRFEDPHYSLPSLEDKMPFLQMLQGFETHPQLPLSPPLTAADTAAAFPFLQEPSFQLLLKLQQEKMNMNFFAGELESCVTTTNNDMIMELHSPIKSEITYKDQTQIPTPTLTQNLSPTNQRENQRKKGARSKRMTQLQKSSNDGGGDATATVSAAPKERRKRKRAARPSKNKEQVESQRMTHIAVERNRRRQMNEHLSALRSLMPPSYVQRGDQASIIGGAIDFVKELEQLLQSLQAQKRMKQCEDQNGDVSVTSTSTSSSSNFFTNMFMASSSSSPSSSFQFRNAHNFHKEGGNHHHHEEIICGENRSSLGNIEVVVIQNHVNLKVQCQRRPGQLLKAIVALEDLRLSVLHLNITSLHSLALYSFNVKIEDDCKLGSADEVASAVHQIFSLINIS